MRTGGEDAMAAAERITLGPLRNPVRGLLHGSAALASLALAGEIGQRSSGGDTRLLLVFALCQAALFAVSALYHSLPWGERAKERMQRLDHSMIYLAIAGAVTALVWIALPEGRREWPVAAAWAVAALGVAQKLWLPRLDERASIPLQVLQAGLALPALPACAELWPAPATLLLVASLLCYSVGALVFVAKRPCLWPRIFSFHELFHALVVLGSGLQAALALRYLAPGP
jgi:hemolysin III